MMSKNAINSATKYEALCAKLSFYLTNSYERALVFRNITYLYKDIHLLISQCIEILCRHSALPVFIFKLEASPLTIGFILASIFLKKTFVPVSLSLPYNKLQHICIELNTEGYFTALNQKIVYNHIVNIQTDHTASKDLQDIAYIMYTSGSTGMPKGVKISYDALYAFLIDISKEIEFHQYQNFIWLSRINFDISLLEIFIPLLHGKTIYIAEEQDLKYPKLLIKKLINSKINVMQITPSQFELLNLCGFADRLSEDLKVLLFGGEAICRSHVQSLISKPLKIYNMYGPTEATIWCSTKRITSVDRLSVGKGFGHNSLKIMHCGKLLDADRAYVKGELLICGNQLFSGYTDPMIDETVFVYINDKKYYCSGDIAYYDDYGEIYICGRIDNQVKINGVRIELEDIEHFIEKELGIRTVALLTQNEKGGGEINIVCESKVLDCKIDLLSQLRRIISLNYPNGVNITNIITLKRFPLNNNGKIDRNEVKKCYMKQSQNIKSIATK